MWIIIISLLAIGLTLIIVEVIFIPGTTIVGLLGLIFTIVGIIISFQHFGRTIGWYTLVSTSILALLSLIYSFRSNAWSRFSLKSVNSSRVNENQLIALVPGEVGTAISALRPMGKVQFKDVFYEAQTFGSYIDAQQKVRVVQIRNHHIIVEPILENNKPIV